jgi:acetyl-CoA carboxylase biotin carboxyl carrier protein
MNLKEIREIINLMNEHDLTEIEIEREGTKIKLKKAGGEMIVSSSRPSIGYREEPLLASSNKEPALQAIPSNRKAIISPMVGTFYRAPSPEAPSFVEVGQVVEIGQVVCIIEAMKLMNEIKSEVRGKVVEISVENAQPVEFGQTLFAVEPV